MEHCGMTTITKTLVLFLGFSLCLVSCKPGNGEEPAQEDSALAFPEAGGGGKYTTGGRNGVVYYVTSLADDVDEAGTLRYALKQSTTRTILFKVSGRIDLKSELHIRRGNVTIAGQSAPGDGICISGYPVIIDADNVVLRFLRFRMGDEKKVEGDALTCVGHKNVIIDHCSFSWSTDECVSVYGNTDFTLQYCFITESLRTSVHDKGSHGYGGIWGGTNATFHHNLFAHHDSRNPRFDHDFVNTKCAGPVDYVNNVIFNWGGNSAYGGEGTNKGAGGRHINMVSNYYKYGPASSKKQRIVNPTTECGDYCGKSPGGTVEPGKFYIVGNFVYGSSSVTADNWQGVDPDESSKKELCHASTRWTEGLTALINEQTAEEAFEIVLDKAGCSLSRDAVDTRIVEDVRNGIIRNGVVVTSSTVTGSVTPKKGEISKGGLIDTQTDVGGWPSYASTPLPSDTDGDGIPDEWESEHGLNPSSYADGKATTLNPPYTNLEVYLNSLVQNLY